MYYTFGLRYGYDVRGNIASITRNGLVDGETEVIDDLTFTYKSDNANLLDKVTDAGVVTEGYKHNQSDSSYYYDSNGNLTRDNQKGISIQYNHLDLCSVIAWSRSKRIHFTYSADGSLLRKEVLPLGLATTTIDYVGPLEYKNGEIYAVHHAEGRIVRRPTDGGEDELVLGGAETQSQHYRANTIESSSLLKGGQINYEANEGIRLTNGFHASRNATFHAFMGEGDASPTEWVYEWDVTDHFD